MIKSGKLTNTKATQPFLTNEMIIIITLKQEKWIKQIKSSQVQDDIVNSNVDGNIDDNYEVNKETSGKIKV